MSLPKSSDESFLGLSRTKSYTAQELEGLDHKQLTAQMMGFLRPNIETILYDMAFAIDAVFRDTLFEPMKVERAPLTEDDNTVTFNFIKYRHGTGIAKKSFYFNDWVT